MTADIVRMEETEKNVPDESFRIDNDYIHLAHKGEIMVQGLLKTLKGKL